MRSEEWTQFCRLEFDDFVQELYLYLSAECQKAEGELGVLEAGLDDFSETEQTSINLAMSMLMGESVEEAKCKRDVLSEAVIAMERFISGLTSTKMRRENNFRRVKVEMVHYHQDVEGYAKEYLTEADEWILNNHQKAIEEHEKNLAELGYPIIMGIEAYVQYGENAIKP